MSDKEKTSPQSNNIIFSRSNSQNQGNTNLNNDDQRLAELGFEEGELEMFFDTYNISPDALIRKYLEIAQKPPYNLNWDTESVAASANDPIGKFEKHDIASYTLNSFYLPEMYKDQDQEITGGNRKTKRRGRKTRKTKRRKTLHRRRKTLHRRRKTLYRRRH
jgi:hypothetical protein